MPQDLGDEQVSPRSSGRLGNGQPRAAVSEVEETVDDQTNENIFMFIPNQIGELYDDSAAS
jgi:hypothetical protein